MKPASNWRQGVGSIPLVAAGVSIGDVLSAIYAAADDETPWTGALEAVACFMDADAAELADDHLVRPGAAIPGTVMPVHARNGTHMEVRIGAGPREAWLRVVRRSGVRFDHHDAEALEIIAPHVRRVVALRKRAVRCAAEVRALDTFEHLGVAALVTDASLVVTAVNATAAEVLAGGSALSVVNGCLRTTLPGAQVRLQCGISAVLAGQSRAGMITIRQPEPSPPVVLRVLPCTGTPSAILLLGPAERRWSGLETLLRDGYGLSPAECELTRLIVSGHSLNQAAVILGTMPNTVRTQLKNVLRKTGTGRQAELVSVILERMLLGS